MSIMTFVFRIMAARSDAKRDKGLSTPEDITRFDNIDYVGDGIKEHTLDVYIPAGTAEKLPTIVSIHGGGWVYGSKEIYQYYGMSMAQRGFAFVNFNYRLAPKYKYPAPLFDTSSVLDWVVKNAPKYHLDPDNIFLVGDSAGAQLACQYAAISTNKEYSKRFAFPLPNIKIRAVALNCGIYEPLSLMAGPKGRPSGMVKDYFGRHPEILSEEINVIRHISPNFLPTFVMVSVNDGLRPFSTVLVEKLKKMNIAHVFKAYGHNDSSCGHVFHVNVRKAEAKRCNDDEVAFFKSYIAK